MPYFIGFFALVALATNSLFARIGLGDGHIDPASYTVIRLGSGALALALILLITKKKRSPTARGRWDSALMLFLYAVFFSFAYIKLTTASGTLILFGAVQCTMIGASIAQGSKLSTAEWVGVIVTICGLIYLLLPGIEAPPLKEAALMLISGVAWGFYSLNGQSSSDVVSDTAYNFIRTIPLLVVTLVLFHDSLTIDRTGFNQAFLSGAVTSGLGYILWYQTVKMLTATQAAVLQLSVPIIAAFLGVLFVNEPLTQRLILATCLILGGILLVIMARQKKGIYRH